MRNKLTKLEEALQVIEAPVLNFFNKGLSSAEILHLFDKVGLSPTNELIALYERWNGIRYKELPSGKICLGVNGVFYPLEDSIDIYRLLSAEGLGNYFPIFSDDSFVMQLDRNSKDFGGIFIYSPSLVINEPEQCFDSLSSMIETFAVCFEHGACFYDADGFFDIDYAKRREIASILNPMSPYWRNDC